MEAINGLDNNGTFVSHCKTLKFILDAMRVFQEFGALQIWSNPNEFYRKMDKMIRYHLRGGGGYLTPMLVEIPNPSQN